MTSKQESPRRHGYEIVPIVDEPEIDPTVFAQPRPLTKAEIKAGMRRPVQRVLSVDELSAACLQIFDSGQKRAFDWGVYSHSKYPGVPHAFTFSPWFNANYAGIDGKEVITDDRVRVVLPTLSLRNPILHFQRRVREGFNPDPSDEGMVYYGFEVVLDDYLSENPSAHTPRVAGEHRAIDDTDRIFWPTLSEMTTAAFETIVPQIDQPADSASAANIA